MGFLCGIGPIAKQFRAAAEGKGPGSEKEHGGETCKSVCQKIFCALINLEPHLVLLRAQGGMYIMMGYNGTLSGMNTRLWAPWFALPTMCALLRAKGIGSGQLHDRLRQWRNVSEPYVRRKMRLLDRS
jgi:hypothetical protein